jgi:hypothetical protein
MRTFSLVLLIVFTATLASAAQPFVERALPAPSDDATEWRRCGMVAGDIDGDGSNEVMVAYQDLTTTAEHRVVTYRWHAGDFRELCTTALSHPDANTILFLEDTDTDGLLELVTVEMGGDDGSPLTIHEWNGDSWASVWTHMFTSVRRSNSVAVGDTDGDGYNEMAVALDWYSRELVVVDYDATTDTYAVSQTIGGNDFRSVEIGDVDADGALEIVAGCGNWSWYDARVYEWDGSEYVLAWDSPTYGNVTAGILDHDGDGVDDLVVANWASPHVSGQNGLHFYAWDGADYAFQYTLSPDVPLLKPRQMDFDNDGVEDLAVIARETDEPGDFVGDGLHFYTRSGTQMAEYVTVPGIVGRGGSAVHGLDLDSDGYLEVVATNIYRDADDHGVWLQHAMDFPFITRIGDIPLDDGRRVRVDWTRSTKDDLDAAVPVNQYNVWREVVDGWKSAKSELVADIDGIQYELVGSTPAMRWDTYSLIVPTLADSAEVEDPLWSFVVTAHLDDGSEYYMSPTQQGYSVDQTAPPMPEGFDGEFVVSELRLSWNPVEAADLSHYTLYRTPLDGGPDVEIGSTEHASFVVPGLDVGNYVYRVTAKDWTGNESERAEFDASVLTGVDDGHELPGLQASLSAYPNPFNPQTTVDFAVPSAGPVRLSVYDVGGRLVRQLVSEVREAGTHSVTWDGRDDTGRQMSSGTYMLRMETGDVAKVRRVMMVK